MKKAVAAILCLALVFQLAGCGAVDTAKKAAGKAGQKAGELAESAAEGIGKAGEKAAEGIGKAGEKAAEGIGKAVDKAGDAVERLSLPDFKKGFETAADYFGTTVAALGGQDYVRALAETVDRVQGSVADGVKAGSGAVAAWAGDTAQRWKDGLFDVDAAGGREKVLAADDPNAAAQRSATRQARQWLEDYGDYAASDAQPASIEAYLAARGVDMEKTADLYFAVYREQLRAIPAGQADAALDLILAAAEAGAAKGPAGRRFVAERDLEALRELAERLRAANGQTVPLKAAEAEALVRSARDGDLDELFLTLLGALDAGVQGAFVAKQAIKSGTTPTLLEAAVVLGPQIYEIIRLGVSDGTLDGAVISAAAFERLSPAGDGYLKGAVGNALTVLCREGRLGQAFVEATPQVIGTMTVLVLDAVRYGILLGAGQITTDQYLDAMAEEIFISAGTLGTAALIGMLFPEATVAVLLGSFVGGLVASAGYSAAKDCVLALIEESDVDLLVPIRATAGAIRDLTATLSVELADALAGLKKVTGETYDKVAVKVYDLTGRV